ncbi:MAG: hypothetical protein KJ757_01175 [Planctomycetes bacterium]|nr:hypothetical protein [Planctomycetota bacterium]MBU2596166.1 hypothetical protein [Planctomycetota bacterium]
MKSFIKNYLQPPFLLSVVCLLATAGFVSYFKAYHGITLIKKPLPLKQSFDDFDEKLLEHYKVLRKAKIENQDVLESLGTEDYLQWFIEDTTVDIMSPTRNCSIFITYYTGNPDQVPHVPEACYIGGGNQVVSSSSITLDLGDVDMAGQETKIPATMVVFTQKSAEIWQTAAEFPVIYFFKVNGAYKGNRTSVRIALGNLINEYSYFCKVELKFFNTRGIYPDKQQSIEAARKLLKVLLPVLGKYYWPDWEQVNRL